MLKLMVKKIVTGLRSTIMLQQPGLNHFFVFTGDHLKPEFLKKNPFHKVPIIIDNGITISERFDFFFIFSYFSLVDRSIFNLYSTNVAIPKCRLLLTSAAQVPLRLDFIMGANTIYPDQTAPFRAVLSGSIL